MVYGQIAIQTAKTVWRFRKQIYKGLVAQDKIIGTTWKMGGYSKWTSAGIRHGALAGSTIGGLIGYQGEDSGNAIQKPQSPSSNQVGKTYSRQSRRYSRRSQNVCRPRYRFRNSNRRYNSSNYR